MSRLCELREETCASANNRADSEYTRAASAGNRGNTQRRIARALLQRTNESGRLLPPTRGEGWGALLHAQGGEVVTNIQSDIDTLRPFMSGAQLQIMRRNCRGEESEFFILKLREYAARVDAMPKPYEQDGKGDQAIVYLHYFKGNMDFWITERDSSDQQAQAFGLADLGYGSELGYISIEEITSAGVELDLHWTPRPISQIADRAAA